MMHATSTQRAGILFRRSLHKVSSRASSTTKLVGERKDEEIREAVGGSNETSNYAITTMQTQT